MPSWRGQGPLLIFYTINTTPISHRHRYQTRYIILPVFVEKFLHTHIRHVTTTQLVLRVSFEIYTATTNFVKKIWWNHWIGITNNLPTLSHDAMITVVPIYHPVGSFLSQVETHGWQTRPHTYRRARHILVAGNIGSRLRSYLSRLTRTTM